MFNLRSQSYPIGIDISDLSIKAAQIQARGKKFGIQAMGKAVLSPGLINNGEIADLEAVSREIGKLLDHPVFGRFTSREVVMNLPDQRTFIKLIMVERTPNRLEDMINSEVQKHVPFSLDEIFFDWQLVRSETDRDLVLVGAAPKNTINRYIELARAAKLELDALEIEAQPICRSLLREESPHFKQAGPANYGLIDIGANRTSLIVYSDRAIVFTVSLPIASDDLTAEIARQLEISHEQAEKAKVLLGLEEDAAQGIVKKILTDMIEDLNKHLKEAISYYKEHYPDNGALSQIFLTGGGSNVKGLVEAIGRIVELPVSLGDPFVNLAGSSMEAKEFYETKGLADNLIPSKSDIRSGAGRTEINGSYSTAIGLALRGIYEAKNLL